MSKFVCPHCHDPDPARVPGAHLPAAAGTPQLAVGQVVVARRITGVCAKDEPGLVVETYRIGDRPGWTVLFRGGGRDGWTPCEAGLWLQAGPVVAGLADYRYGDAAQLAADLRAGLFEAALETASACTDP